MKKEIVGIVALFSALLASACCLGPIVLGGLGLAGAGLGAEFSKYRPLFLALTAILLGAAFYLTYRKREVACADGACKLQSGSKTIKAVLWLITVFAVGATAFPYWSVLLLGKSPVASSANAKTITLKISGMTCTACAVLIEKSLKSVPGVQSVSVDFDKTEALVWTEPEKVPAEVLIQAVQAAGSYTAEVQREN